MGREGGGRGGRIVELVSVLWFGWVEVFDSFVCVFLGFASMWACWSIFILAMVFFSRF